MARHFEGLLFLYGQMKSLTRAHPARCSSWTRLPMPAERGPTQESWKEKILVLALPMELVMTIDGPRNWLAKQSSDASVKLSPNLTETAQKGADPGFRGEGLW